MALDDLLSVEDGVKMFMDYKERNPNSITSLGTFYRRFEPDSREMLEEKKVGPLRIYYSRFLSNRKKGDLSNETTFKDWVKSQIPSKLAKKLDRYLPPTLEDGVRMFIEFKEINNDSKTTLSKFYTYFNPQIKVTPKRGKMGPLHHYYGQFIIYRKKGSIPKETTFEDWVKSQIPSKMVNKLDRYIPAGYSLEDGVNFYIKHIKKDPESNITFGKFYRGFNPKNGEVMKNRQKGPFSRYYRFFLKERNKFSNPNNRFFPDWIISQLPENQREQATYYIKGQYLKDLAKQKIDTQQLKSIVLGGQNGAR